MKAPGWGWNQGGAMAMRWLDRGCLLAAAFCVAGIAGCAVSPVLPAGDHFPAIDMTYKNAHPPRYPMTAVTAHHQGTVVLDVFVDTRSRVSDVKVQRSSGYPALDRAAEAAARHWRYAAGVKDGKPYASVLRVPVTFSM
ncbi:MAG: energy transducer TonB [Rhodanobacteraceae bacterium]|nr:MAG: energy transducer TonB [Rhodanobacteraceae bacterium]